MNYQKAYKEALAHAREIYRNEEEKRRDMEFIFPELKESKDEKIKKEIISFIQDALDEINLKVSGDYDDRDEDDIAHQNWCKKAIAWLENIPVSNDLEEAACEYDNSHIDDNNLAFKAGAQWQKEQMMKDAVEAVVHPYDGEIWVNKDLLSIYDDCQRVKLIIEEE